MDHFHTPHLEARRLQADDLPQLLRMNGNPEVMKTLGGVRDEDATRAFLEESLAHWDTYSFGVYTLWTRPDKHFAGRCGLRHVAPEGVDEVEVHLGLMPDCWGRGFGTEVVRSLVHIGFTHLPLESIIAFTLCTNLASQHVMEKAGFRYEKDFVYKGMPHVLTRLRREEALRNHATAS